MKFQVLSYLKFILRATNRHGIHSPFVYDLATYCLYNTAPFEEYILLKRYRRKIKESPETIRVTDFGAGSRIFTSNERRVSDIAATAGIAPKRQQLLFRLASYFKPGHILELGTSLGMSTAALSLGHPSAKITTVEGCSETASRASAYFREAGFNNITLQKQTFEDFFLAAATGTYDMVYIDGNHDEEKTLQYFSLLLKHVTDDSVLIFDDIYWSPGMAEAWKEISGHPAVTVSIDMFYWGMVFFRKKQPKQHFILRV